MAVNPDAPVRISALSWVPDGARGYVKDLRVRWALEEAGIDYAVRLLDMRTARPADYLEEQPFGQVPSYVTPEVTLFESGAIVLYIGETCPVLLPLDPAARARATAWVFAALSSVEPWAAQLGHVDSFQKDEPWAAARRPSLVEMARARLKPVADRLTGRDWLEAEFTVADLIMSTVIRDSDFANAEFPALAAHRARCEARPAFQRALAAQMADFTDD